MRHLFYFLFLFSSIAARSQAIGAWQDHLPYSNAVALCEGKGKLYTAVKSALFVYDPEDGSLQKLSKANGLSDISKWSTGNHSQIAYYPALDLLLVAYTNGNIDLVKGQKIINIPDIKNASVLGTKKINRIRFIGNYAYLSTSFGIVAVDLINYQIKDTYRLRGVGLNCMDMVEFEGYFYAATDEGLFRAPSDGSVNLLNFQSWEGVSGGSIAPGACDHVFIFDNRLMLVQNERIHEFNGSSWQLFFDNSGYRILNYSIQYGHLLLTSAQYGSDPFIPDDIRILRVAPDGSSAEALPNTALHVVYQCIEYPEGEYWVADFYNGLYHFQNGSGEFIHPNGPASESVFAMTHANAVLYVAPGGVNSAFNFLFNRDGFFLYQDGRWQTFDQYVFPELNDYLDILDVVVNKKSGEAYFASIYGGVIKYKDWSIETYNKDNSALQAPSGDPDRTTAAGLALDRDGNLWVANYMVSKPLVVITPDGNSYAYPLPRNISEVSRLIIDDFGQKWIIPERNNNAGLIVYDDNGTLDNSSDDRAIVLDGGSQSGGLHSNKVRCAAKDKDGAIWVGTEEGVAVFYCPGSVLDGNCSASRPLIEIDGNLNYLLETESINDIEVDAANRKWFATNRGVFLMNEDGDRQIAYFNSENSPLLSDIVHDISIDKGQGIVYFGTDNGIISYIGSAADNYREEADCKIYPNPVRPDYRGPVTIDNVVPNAEIKITDISGNLFFEGIATGSRMVWDGYNYNGDRASSGVYLVFIADPNGNRTKVCRFLIVN